MELYTRIYVVALRSYSGKKDVTNGLCRFCARVGGNVSFNLQRGAWGEPSRGKKQKENKKEIQKKKRIKESLREINFDLEPRIGNFI